MSIDVNAIDQTVEVTAVGDEINVNIIDQPVLVSVTDQIIEVAASAGTGPQGPAGAGVAAGGVTGQVLSKLSNTNYDTVWVNAGAGTVYSVNASGSTGISVTGGPITGAGTLTITNTAPDQVVGLTGAGTAVITGAYPNFTITTNDQFNGTVTSVNLTAGTGISVSGGPITTSGNINVVNTAPDQVVSLTSGGTTTITGTYPNFTISSADSTLGTVTSVNMTVPTGLTISGNPITSAGTLALALASGYSIPTTASQATWDAAYNDKINSAAVTGTTTKTLTLNQQDGGTVTASWTDINTDAVTSVFGRTGAVVATGGDYTTSQVTEVTNLYYTEGRVSANSDVAANTAARHNAVTLGTANGLSLSTQALSLALASGSTTGALSSTDWSTFNSKQSALSGTGFVKISGTTISYDNSTYYLASNPSAFIALTALSAGTGISYNNTTGVITNSAPDQTVSITAGSGISVSGTYPSFTVASTITQYTDALARAAISLTVTGASGASTYNNTTGVLNVPTYTLTGLGGVPSTRSITINGTAFDLSADRTYNVGTVTSITLATGTTGTDVNVSNGTITTSGTITLNIPDASATARGLITTGIQTIAGAKTFSSSPTVPSLYLSDMTAGSGALYYNVAANRLTLANYNVGGILVFETNGGAINMTLDASANLSVVGSVTAASLIKSGGTSGQFLKADGSVDSTAYGTGSVTSVAATAGTGITISGSPITSSGTLTITNSAPDQVVALTGAGTTTISGTYPNFTISSSDSAVGTVTSVGLSSATSGVTIGSTPVTTSGTITLAIATATGSQNGLLSSIDYNTFIGKQNAITLTTTGTSGAATLVGATLNIPNYADQFVGTVTSVAALTLATTGTDLSSTVANGTTTPVITLNVPTASATNRGALSSADWSTFNSKQGTITLTTTGTSGAATFSSNTLNIPQYQSALTNPVTGTGTTNYLPKFTGASTIGNSQVFDNGTSVGINTAIPLSKFDVRDASAVMGNYQTIQAFSTDSAAINLGGGISLGGYYTGTSSIAQFASIVGRKENSTSGNYDGYLAFGTNSQATGVRENMRLTSSGNLGLGVTPSAWASGYTVLQVLNLSLFGTSGLDLNLASNTYYDGTSYKYIGSGYATMYNQFQGKHYWSTAGTSTAGNAITFTQAMTLDASGRLGIGTTSPQSNLQVLGTIKVATGNAQGILGLGEANGATVNVGIWRGAANAPTTDGNYLNLGGYEGIVFAASNAVIGSQAERMRITSGGDLGLGTTAPTNKFDLQVANKSTIVATASAINVNYSGSTTGQYQTIGFSWDSSTGNRNSYWGMGFTGTSYGSGTGDLFFFTGGNTRLTIASTGAATFSSSVTATIFDSTSNAFRFNGNNAMSLVSLGGQSVVKINAAGYWGTQLVGANDQGILINNSGSVGINTTSPAYKLDVNGGIYGKGLTADSDGGVGNALYAYNQVLSGSSTNALIQLATSWNTTGNADAIVLDVTNTASGASSRLLDLKVGGSSIFKVQRNGRINASSLPTSSVGLSAGDIWNDGGTLKIV